MEITALESIEDLGLCCEIERRVWGVEDIEVSAASQLRAVGHAGGLVAGAWVDGCLVGFAFGFPSFRPSFRDSVGFHSHLLAVLPEYRGMRIGQSLKWFQREWCLARGMSWMTWTFDPLQAKNARLNFEHLGVMVHEYRQNEYGVMGGHLNASLPTDRVLALWELTSDRVKRLALGEVLPAVRRNEHVVVLRALEDGTPGEVDLLQQAGVLQVDIPRDINALIMEDMPLALCWRYALREVLEHYLARGYRIDRFEYDHYLLIKSEDEF